MSQQSSQPTDGNPVIENYFCVLCPEAEEVFCFKTKSELEMHLRDTHLKDSPPDESHAIDLWIERHIKYEELLNKSMAQTIKTIPDRNKTIYKGCPVCDRIIKVFKIGSNASKKVVSHELLVKDINTDYSGNSVNHINPHLKYYPYECLICKSESEESQKRGDPEIKEVVKASVKAMMRRHIIDKHLKNTPLVRDALEQEIEKSIQTLKVTVLERVTKKQSTSPNPRPSNRKIKVKSVPGPLRKAAQPEPLKRLHPILPTHSIIIPIASVGPLSQDMPRFLSTLPPQPLMTSTPLPPNRVKSEEMLCEEVIKSEESSPSSHEISDNDFDEIKDEREVFGCVFCLKRLQNYDKVFEHYLLHVNAFMGCAKCDLKFKTIADFRSHNTSHIENDQNSNLLNVNQYKTARNWIYRFLDLMKNNRNTLLLNTYDLDECQCSVCAMALYVFKYSSKQVLPEKETIETHFHNHLNYFPFECIDCNYEDIKTEFYLDSKAKKHLYEKHNIRNADALNARELSAYFVKKNPIDKLDQIIQMSVDFDKRIKEFDSLIIK